MTCSGPWSKQGRWIRWSQEVLFSLNHFVDPSESSFLQAGQSQLSQPLLIWKMLFCLNFLLGAFVDYLQSVFSLYLWVKRWTQISWRLSRGGELFPLTGYQCFPYAAQEAVGEQLPSLLQGNTMCSYSTECPTWHHGSLFFYKISFQSVSPQPVLAIESDAGFVICNLSFLCFIKFFSAHFSSLLNGNTGMWCMNHCSLPLIICNFAEGLLFPNPGQ